MRNSRAPRRRTSQPIRGKRYVCRKFGEANTRDTIWERYVHCLRPDLVVKRVQLVPRKPRVGRTFQMWIVVQNRGDRAAPPTRLLAQIRIGRPGFRGPIFEVPGLRPRQTHRIAWAQSAPMRPGSLTLRATVDVSRRAAEISEANCGFWRFRW